MPRLPQTPRGTGGLGHRYLRTRYPGLRRATVTGGMQEEEGPRRRGRDAEPGQNPRAMQKPRSRARDTQTTETEVEKTTGRGGPRRPGRRGRPGRGGRKDGRDGGERRGPGGSREAGPAGAGRSSPAFLLPTPRRPASPSGSPTPPPPPPPLPCPPSSLLLPLLLLPLLLAHPLTPSRSSSSPPSLAQ